MARVVFFLVLACVATSARAEFCADLQNRYSSGILRCIDFAAASDASVNPSPNAFRYGGTTTVDTRLFDAGITATPGATGALHWKIRSYDQVRAEEPNLTKGQAWVKAMDSNTGAWQRWIGLDKLTPGQTYWYQFKWRFNPAYKTWWGGAGPKVFGLDQGCRTVNGTQIPSVCESYSGSRFTGMSTATSMEFGTMTTSNWFPSSVAGADKRPYNVLYQGSTNWALSQGLSPLFTSPKYATESMEQPGRDSGWTWDGKYLGNTCASYDRYYNPDYVVGGPCVTNAPDVWHEVTIALRPSGNFYDTNPAVTAKQYRHDTLFKVWIDGQLISNFDPNEPPFRAGQPSAADCAAQQVLHPKYDDCHTGVDLFKDSREANVDSADLTQFILWTFSYRSGYPAKGGTWCDTELTSADTQYNFCKSLEGSGDDADRFDAFLHHPQVDVYMDDWVVATTPLPMHRRPATARVGAGSFGTDARDLDAVPANTWVRLFPGPDRTIHNTGFAKFAPDDPFNPTPGSATVTASSTNGAAILSGTNYSIEIPVLLGVPVSRGFNAPHFGNNKIFYFGGGHSNVKGNRVELFDLATGRWTESSAPADMGEQVPGGIGPRFPTPPGTGCTTEPFASAANGNSVDQYFATTGDVTAGSNVITNVASLSHVCPINGTCGGSSTIAGGYTIVGAGIPQGTVVRSIDATNHTATLTAAATSSGTGVALSGGKPLCSTAGAPNGSPGGRPWWEHTDDRIAYDARAGGWIVYENSGTWLYNEASASWKLIVGATAGNVSLMCGPGDYTRLSLRYAKQLRGGDMLAWCSTDVIYALDYGSGAPDFTGAKWLKLAQGPKNPQSDMNAVGQWDDVHQRFYYLTRRTTGVSAVGAWNPMLAWFDPFAAPSCDVASPVYPCGKSGAFDATATNFPQGWSGSSTSGSCWNNVCQQLVPAMAVDKAGDVYVVGRKGAPGTTATAPTDGDAFLWKLTDPLGPNQAWSIIDAFAYNTYDNAGLKLWTDSSPADLAHEFNLGGAQGLNALLYVPDKDAFYFLTRSQSTSGGGGTRGIGTPTSGGCYLNGVKDDCFRMYGFRLGIAAPSGAGGPSSGGSAAPVPTISASVAPTAIMAGQSATLTWTATDATQVTVDGIVRISPYVVTPTSTHTYTLVASGAGGSATAAVTVSVTAVNAPTVSGFAATPATVYVGQSAVLDATITGATSVTIDGYPRTLPWTVSPTVSHTYTLKATNSSGSVSATTTLTVNAAALTLASTSPLPDATTGVAYLFTFAAYGGTPPYMYGCRATSLPPGLTCTSKGVLSGTPTVAGAYLVHVSLVDNAGHNVQADFALNIIAPDTTPPTVSITSTATGAVIDATDSGSGIDTLDVTVTATDKKGNKTTTTQTVKK